MVFCTYIFVGTSLTTPAVNISRTCRQVLPQLVYIMEKLLRRLAGIGIRFKELTLFTLLYTPL